MISEVIQHYEAALRRLISKQPASSCVKISYDGVAKTAWYIKSSSNSKDSCPKEYAPKNQVKCGQIFKDDMNS
jgi:hypothetical protein